MKEQEQIKAIAELEFPDTDWIIQDGRVRRKGSLGADGFAPNYVASYNAIIPVIQKHDTVMSVQTGYYKVYMSPAKLCEELLRSVGKWKD